MPLEFWFCKNNGMALPLLALASADVKLTVTFRKFEESCRIGPTHSIEILDDIIPFKPGDYIEQTIKNQTIYGYVIDYDYLQQKLYYIKIQNPCANKKTFESYQENVDRSLIFNTYQSFEKSAIDTDFSQQNIPFRIYNSITQTYCTPKPNTIENIEQTILPYKPRFINSFLYIDYIYLDNEERNKFARNNHEYLIEQIQFNQVVDVRSPNIKQNLTLNHPCKAHYWVIQLDKLVGPGTINDLFNFTTSHVCYPKLPGSTQQFYGENILVNARLVLNSKDRFRKRGAEYFNLIEPYEHHSRGPNIGINAYSLSFCPENIQPSSAVNMSRIDHICMIMRLINNINCQNTAKIRSYTINYNILRICFNLGNLVFS